jgi:8-oxo-dGTP pyrophosphatase MutT (NUDIX family)
MKILSKNHKKSTAILIWFGDKILLSKRKTALYKGKWSAPGGRAESSDTSLTHTAQRELMEEAGIFLLLQDLGIVDSYEHDEWKCFFFEAFLAEKLFKIIKNVEPKKHSPWELFTAEEALKLDLMPSIREYILDFIDNKPRSS